MRDAHRAGERVDDVGGTDAARRRGRQPHRACRARRVATPPRRVIIGSHLDTVVDAGRYDGILGVMLGIAAATAAFGVGRLAAVGAGSRWRFRMRRACDSACRSWAAGRWRARSTRRCWSLPTPAASTMAEALRGIRPRPAGHPRMRRARAMWPRMSKRTSSKGRCWKCWTRRWAWSTAIAGQSRLTIEWTGQGGHAGTVPMHGRSDAFTAACRWALAVERRGAGHGGAGGDGGARRGRAQSWRTASRGACGRRSTFATTATTCGSSRRRSWWSWREQLATTSRLAARVEYDHEHAAVAIGRGSDGATGGQRLPPPVASRSGW